MPNNIKTVVDTGSVQLGNNEYEVGLLTFGGAGTVIAGTILARDSISLKFVPYVKGGSTNENGIPKAILHYDVEATGAGDESVKPLVSGRVKAGRLVIDADGDATNIDAAVTDQLRDFTIVSQPVDEVNVEDNPQP